MAQTTRSNKNAQPKAADPKAETKATETKQEETKQEAPVPTTPESAVPDAIKDKAAAKDTPKDDTPKRGRKVRFPGNATIKVLKTETNIKAGSTRHKIFEAIVAKDGQTVADARKLSPAPIGAWDLENAIKSGNIEVTVPEPKPEPPKAETAPSAEPPKAEASK